MYRVFVFLIIVGLGAPLTAQSATQPLQVLASVRPIALLAQELTRDTGVQVSTLLAEGTTPHDYALKPSDLQAIQQTDLLIWLGASEEPYLEKVAQRAKADIPWQTLSGLNLLPVREAMHDPSEHHDQHDTSDLHIWFDTRNGLLLAQALQEKLVALQPELQTVLARNLQRMTQGIEQQKEHTRTLLAGQSQPFLLAHDAYQYLEADLGVQSVGALVLNPEIKPGAKHLMQLKQEIVRQRVRCLVSSPQVSEALLDKIDADPPMTRIGIDPLAWDFEGDEFSLWLASVYVKMVVCGGGD